MTTGSGRDKSKGRRHARASLSQGSAGGAMNNHHTGGGDGPSISGGVSKGKISFPGYGTVTETDVVKYFDYFHKSLDIDNNKFGKQKFIKKDSRVNSGVNILAKEISTRVVSKPVLRELPTWFDLEERPPMWCCYSKLWDARGFAHNLSSNFSSHTLCMEEKSMVGMVDFVSDWKNIKTLLHSHESDNHLSFLLHRVGNSVTIDHLDLLGVQLFPGFLDLPQEFVEFINKVVGNNKDKIKFEGKSNEEVLAKEAFHRLLHFSMTEPMKLENTDLNNGKHAEGTLPGTGSNFLNRVLLSTGKVKLLVGSNIPVFAKPDSTNVATVRTNDAKAGAQLKTADAFDFWLDNKLMECPETLVSHHVDWSISETQWIKTDDLPQFGKFDLNGYLEHGEKLLEFIKENVKGGHSYWLYRAPGSCEITVYNITNIRVEKEETKLSIPIFDSWKTLHTPYFQTSALIKYAELIGEAMTLKLPTDSVCESEETTMFPGKLQAKTDKNPKLHKLNFKLEAMFNVVKEYLKTESWMVKNLEDINWACFLRIVELIQQIYKTASSIFPNMANYFRVHAVERYFPTCSKLVRACGPFPSFGSAHLYWESTELMRAWMMRHLRGVSDILSFLIIEHGHVAGIPMDQMTQKQEWLYLGCRIRLLNADILTVVAKKCLEETIPPLDGEVPENLFDLILQLYLAAKEKLPEIKVFRVKHCFVPPACDNLIDMEDLMDELNWKLSTAFLDAAKFAHTYPCNVYAQEKKPVGNTSKIRKEIGDEATGRLSHLEKIYQDIGTLLTCSIEHAAVVRPRPNGRLVPKQEIDDRISLVDNIMGKIYTKKFILYNAEFAELLNFSTELETAPIPDAIFDMWKFSNTINAVSMRADVGETRTSDGHCEKIEYLTTALECLGKAVRINSASSKVNPKLLSDFTKLTEFTKELTEFENKSELF